MIQKYNEKAVRKQANGKSKSLINTKKIEDAVDAYIDQCVINLIKT